jgi:hypothetical protein
MFRNIFIILQPENVLAAALVQLFSWVIHYPLAKDRKQLETLCIPMSISPLAKQLTNAMFAIPWNNLKK